MGEITVTGLCTYPIKSCAGVALTEARVTPRGLGHDRDYMVVDEHASFVSQRQLPRLALVVPVIREDAIVLSAPGMQEAEVPLLLAPDDTRTLEATVHGKPVVGQAVSDELDAWFTRYLAGAGEAPGAGPRYRLLRVREDAPRHIAPRYRREETSNEVGFADGHSMLLASERSLAALCRELDAPVPMNRFRPNVVVDGDDLQPYDEDRWTELRLGALHAFVVKACDRCTIPDVDQETAVVGKDVRRALVSRRGANAHDETNTGVFFAQNLAHVYEPGTTIRVGDAVRVLGRNAEPNVVLRAALA